MVLSSPRATYSKSCFLIVICVFEHLSLSAKFHSHVVKLRTLHATAVDDHTCNIKLGNLRQPAAAVS